MIIILYFHRTYTRIVLFNFITMFLSQEKAFVEGKAVASTNCKKVLSKNVRVLSHVHVPSSVKKQLPKLFC